MSELSDFDLGLPSESAEPAEPMTPEAHDAPAPEFTVGQKLDSVLNQLNPAERAMYTARTLHIIYGAEAIIPTYNRQ